MREFAALQHLIIPWHRLDAEWTLECPLMLMPDSGSGPVIGGSVRGHLASVPKAPLHLAGAYVDQDPTGFDHFLPFLLRCVLFSFASALSTGSSSASKTKYWPTDFCSRSFDDAFLLTRGRKLTGSRRNVTSNCLRKQLNPSASPCATTSHKDTANRKKGEAQLERIAETARLSVVIVIGTIRVCTPWASSPCIRPRGRPSRQ